MTPQTPDRSLIIWKPPLVLAFLCLLVGTLVVATSAHGKDGSGESYWGPIEARADSNSTEVEQNPRPAWEYPLLVPYRIVQLPFRAVVGTIGAAYVYADESGLAYRIAQILGPKELPYGALLTVKGGGLSGIGGGVSIFHKEFFGPHNRLKIRTTFTSKGETKATLGTLFGDRKASMLEVGGGYRIRRNARYFGLGPDAGNRNESFYSQETSWGGFLVSQRIKDELRIELGTLYSGVGARRPHDEDEPALPDLFNGTRERTRPFGYGDLSTGLTLNLGIVRDGTMKTGRPESGSIQRLRATYFTSTGDEAESSFWSYRLDLEQFIGLWHTERALAIRGYVNWLDEESDLIPFQRLLTNDEPDLFRGFKDYRWRDRGLTGLSLEYRWPLWVDNQVGGPGLDVYLLTDVGQVFNEFEEISARNVQVSYGGGIRMIGRDGYNGRLEMAWSKDEFVLRVGSDQIFQYARGGLFNGRDQSALR